MKSLTRFTHTLIAAVIAMTALFLPPAMAATPNYSQAVTGVEVIPIQLSGQYTADVTAVTRFALPFPARVVGVSASARASGGTSPTLTVDLQDDGTSILSSPVSVTAGSVAEATISTLAVADESVMTIDLAIGGTNPTWDDITVFVTAVRQ